MNLSRLLHKLVQRTPVAWLQVTNNPTKLLIGVAGVSFSNLLMFFQLGLLDSLYNSQQKPILSLEADLVMVSAKFSHFGALQEFDRSRLFQVLGVDGVAWVSPLRVARGNWITPGTRNRYDIFVYGINPVWPSFRFAEIEQNRSQLQLLGHALFDQESKSQFGPVLTELSKNNPFLVEVNNTQVGVIGTFRMGTTFDADANLITTENTFFQLFKNSNPSRTQLGLIGLKPGASAERVQAEVAAILESRDAIVLSRQQLAQRELNYWKRTSAVGFIFSLGVLVGFLVGGIIVYQILYGDVMNSLPQYATLKAMGYRDPYVIGIVIQQAAILAVVGFIPGLLLSTGLYVMLANVTRLAVAMSLERAIQLLVLTFVMCVASGSLATRKLVQLDPADVF
ncbi:MAG: ABC transporter permease DevC [Synechococcaceae cyanobacterium]